jgi:hypothetical protein
MYSHGIATIALSEALGMTGDESLREPVGLAAEFIERARNKRAGGWRYDPGQAGDTSVLGWQVMALKSARMAGVEVPWEAFNAADKWLDLVSTSRGGRGSGRYAYRPGREYTPAMTAEGMFVRQVLGRRPEEPLMRASAEYITRHLPDWDSQPNTYYWYYATLALFQNQGEHWERWNEAITKQLLDNQRRDGRTAGSWDPVGEWARIGGRVYQTALCTLMLEVYYRYLPMYSLGAPADAIGTIRGHVTDMETGDGLSDATVRLDLPDRPPINVTTEYDGGYVLHPPEVPDFFALSATHEGHIPKAVNVATSMVLGTTLRLDFELQPASETVVVIEAVPEVHHLGDNEFNGRINSQFQKRAEGSVFTAEFELDRNFALGGGPEGFSIAEIVMLAKGVQASHRIFINGTLLGVRLNRSPGDGSFGEFTAALDASLLHAGINTIQIRASSVGSDVDDFEFVNLRIRLVR